ncbi:SsrA-binding protein [uncultured Planktosalinus sp.]|uniref:SsrA-binding protein n=1 Tax=uncultured Planktosalinus sp. TaxID=1810935 RepID=UPI0030D6E690
MKKAFFKTLSVLNKWLLPNFTKQRLDLSKAKKWQLAILAWKIYVTKNLLDS